MASPIHITSETLLVDDTGNPAAVLLRFEGQLDETNVDEPGQEIRNFIKSLDEGMFLVLDFEKLTYLNSRAIGYITYWLTGMRKRKGEVVMANVTGNILDILQVVGLTQIIHHFPTLIDAVEYMQSKATVHIPEGHA